MTRILTALFLILLVAFSLAGCSEPAPTAQFYAEDTTGQVPVKIQFNDLSLGEITSWEWDFDNDGEVDSRYQSPKYGFYEPGNFTVSLTVSGPNGSDTEVKVKYLELFPPIYPPCEVDFVAEKTTVNGRIPLKFTDKSTGNITAWSWDFQSDGIIDSTVQNPEYMYTRNGSYSVTLIVSGPSCEEGATLTKYHYIQVSGCSG